MNEVIDFLYVPLDALTEEFHSRDGFASLLLHNRIMHLNTLPWNFAVPFRGIS